MADEKDDPESVEEGADEEPEGAEEAEDREEASASDGDEVSVDEGQSEGEDSDGGGDSSDLVDKMAESDKLEGVSKGEIADALSEVASDADQDDLAEAVSSLAGDEEASDEDEASAEDAQEDVEVEGEIDEAEDDREGEQEEAGDDADEEVADEEESTEEETDREPEPAREPAAAAEVDEDAIGGVFRPDEEQEEPDAPLADRDELGDSDESATGILAVGGISVVLLAVGLVWLFGFSKQGERLVHLFKGDLKEYELAESKKTQAELREKQRKVIDDTPKIGTLEMRGKPQYALIKLDGQAQYASPEGSDYWKAMRLTPKTNFPVFYVEDDHELTIESPGHKTRKVQLQKGNWTPVSDSVPDLDDAALKYNNRIQVTLVPESRARELEFHKRMEKDPENDFYGEVTIESKPEGAKIIFDGSPLKNEDGEELKTPVTFEKYYVEPEEDDEDDEENGSSEEDGLEEKKVKVDMPPDKGHKIQLVPPEGKDYPKFVSGLQREMWTCEWKDGEVPDNPSPEGCNYKFELSVDFDEVKSFIENRKSTRQKIKDAWADAQEQIDTIVEEANKKAGVKPKKKKKKKSGSKSKEKGSGSE